MKWLLVLGALTLHNTARAECDWGDEVESVYATMTTITINGQIYPVRGQTERSMFAARLRECGVDPRAVKAFEDWRAMRRWTNISGIVGACCFFPALMATPVTAILAGNRQEELLLALQSA
ncbi:MAG TPA: hypothetical protein ENK18_24220 [Deltaproteobacteria bacterium]|nr:hypothetical protein [Deltaproteobacteria bacterium]